MEIDRADGRTPNQLRPLSCSRGVLNRAHGSASWSQGNTQILVAVYGPKAGTKKNEDPERASFEVIWKPKSGQIGKQEKEYEMILKRTIQSICILTVNPNTTTSVIVQVVHDDGAVEENAFLTLGWDIPMKGDTLIVLPRLDRVILVCLAPPVNSYQWNNIPADFPPVLPCAINAACAALVDAGIPLKHLAVAICCSLVESGIVMLDPTKLEEEKMKAFTYLVFPNSNISVLTKGLAQSENNEEAEAELGLLTSVTRGAMSVDNYLHCLERGRAATAKLSNFLRRNLQPQLPSNASKAG